MSCFLISSRSPTSWWRISGRAPWRSGTWVTTFSANAIQASSWFGCRATGRPGPDAHKAGYASVAEAASGLRHLNGFPGGPPPRLALSLGDSLAGMFGAQGALAALYRRSVTGHGQVVDVALTESCLAVQESTIPDYDVGGVVRGPSGTRLEGIAPSNIYRSADGSWVVIAANQDTVFARLCQAMGRPELVTDDRFANHGARGRNQDELDKIIGDWAAERRAQTRSSKPSAAAGVIAGPINTVAEVVNDPQLRARDMLVEHYDERLGRPVLGPGSHAGAVGISRQCSQRRPGAARTTQRRRLHRVARQDRRRARGAARRGGAMKAARRYSRGVAARRVADRKANPVVGQAGTAGSRRRHRGARGRGHRVRLANEGAVDGRRRRARGAVCATTPTSSSPRWSPAPMAPSGPSRPGCARSNTWSSASDAFSHGQRRAQQRRGHRSDRRDRRYRPRQ